MSTTKTPVAASGDSDDVSVNRSGNPYLGDIIHTAMSRRQVFRGAAAAAAFVAGASPLGALTSRRALAAAAGSSLTFEELPHGMDVASHVAPGYQAQTLVRWGDAVEPDAPPFDPYNQSAEAQAKQFGYNCDFIAFMPLPRGSQTPDRGLLCVNHEFTDAKLMFPAEQMETRGAELADVEIAAHGHSILEIRRGPDGTWAVVPDSQYNRRISALTTEMQVSGPAAGHDRLKTKADPTGTRVIGTLNNCAGGKTPWGTVLIAEENFHKYFGGDPSKTAESASLARVGIKGEPDYGWYRYHDRFDVEKEPNEPNRFGWMVEIDPYDPQATPKKRTALGRFKHEGATVAVNRDGRIVCYSGDDQRFEYLYRFVTARPYDPDDHAANRDLLDEGTLSVARFNADGTLDWLPLVYGLGPLNATNGFHSQADVVIDARRAADLLGATRMDRPEDVEPNPMTNFVYMALTNNSKRQPDDVGAANPRPLNKHGHVMEMVPPGAPGTDADHAADTFLWNLFLLAGNPADPEDGARYGDGISEHGWLSCPDNVAFDRRGRLWISTDGAYKSGFADGLWACDTFGPGRAVTRHFYRTPIGAELCGPEFNPDSSALFVAVQHPGDSEGSTFENPSTRWPDFAEGMPPRPSVQVVVKQGGGEIG